jgi:hypothetical protein
LYINFERSPKRHRSTKTRGALGHSDSERPAGELTNERTLVLLTGSLDEHLATQSTQANNMVAPSWSGRTLGQ